MLLHHFPWPFDVAVKLEGELRLAQLSLESAQGQLEQSGKMVRWQNAQVWGL